MYEGYKLFLPEERQWNLSFLDATKNKDKKKVIELLRQSTDVYLEEYYIDHCVLRLNHSNLSQGEREEILENLKKCKIITMVTAKKDVISIKTNTHPIMVSKLSAIIPEIEEITLASQKENIVNKSSFRSEYVSQLLSFPNSIVTGYTYGISNKAKSIATWVEFKNNKDQEFVIVPDLNIVYNKEGFYFLKHAEPIKKVAGDDLKGKASKGKSSNSYADFGVSADIIDVEFDIDMCDER